MDFGGNKGELKQFVKGKYVVVNYDYSKMYGEYFDTVVLLAVLEHIEVSEVINIFSSFKKILKKDGKIVITTPTKFAKPILEFLAFLGILDSDNIKEHKYYWGKSDIFRLAEKAGFNVVKYEKFQFGFNQLAIFKHKPDLC